jgi:hypothetical protein
MNNAFLRKITACLLFILFSFISIIAQSFISYTIPSQNQLNVSRNSQIIVGFNESMLDSTLNNNSIIAHGTFSGRQFGEIYYDSSNNTITYSATEAFTSGEKVSITLTNDIKNALGEPLSPAFSFEFNIKSDTGFSTMTCEKYQSINGINSIEDMKVADLDLDGDFDLIFATSSTRKIITYINDTHANFAQFFEYDLEYNPICLSTGDYNNDGRIDVAVAETYNAIFLRASGNGQLHVYGSIEINLTGFLESCDFNNDGNIDAVGLEWDDSSNPQKRKVCYIKNLGNGNFEKIFSYEFIPDFTERLFYAGEVDFDNDGFIDLIISRIEKYQVLFLKNNGEGIFSLLTIKYFNSTPYSFALGDFNSDANIDIAFVTGESGWEGLKVYRNFGDAVFVYFDAFYLHSYSWDTYCTDFNNDGNVDLVASYGVGQRVGIYYGSGDLYFNSINQVWLNPSSNPYLISVADFDTDGDVDIAVLNDGTNGRKLYFLQNGPDISSVQGEEIKSFDYLLSQNYPNPFNPSTVISYQLSVIGFVTLKVYDILGREIATLVNEEKPAGEYEVEFNAANLPSGIYFYQIKAGNFVETEKMVLLK